MRAGRLVGHASALNRARRISQREEPVLGQALVSQPSVDGLDQGVVHGLAGSTELEPQAVLMRPRVQCFAPALRPVLDREALQEASRQSPPFKDRDDARAAQAHRRLDHRTRAR